MSILRPPCAAAPLALAAVLSLPLAAQRAVPAPELQQLSGLVGTWTGSGVMTQAPGAPQGKWTSTHKIDWVLDGHFLREDTRVEFEGGGPGPMVFRTYFGFDDESHRLRAFEVGNMGMIKINDLFITEDGAIVVGGQSVWDGKVVVARWVTRVKGDTFTMAMHEAVGSGDFFAHVTGEAKKTTTKVSDIAVAEASAMMAEAAVGAMKRFASSVGEYTFRGRLMQTLGAPMVDISGRETVRMILGGTVLESQVQGDPIAGVPGKYESISYIGWDAGQRRFMTCRLSNVGEIQASEGHLVEGKLITTVAGTHAGRTRILSPVRQPNVARTVMEFDADGAFAKVAVDAITGTAAAQRVFEGTYARKK